MTWLEDRAVAVITGAAVGDALGGATEGWTPEQIEERHGGRVTGIVGPWYPNWRDARPIAPYHKGDGHITDDTLMTCALVEVYAKRRAHLDAYAMAEDLVPLMIGEPRWVPELETSALLLQRVFLAEKWIVTKLHYGHADPREAGAGNVVNCGAAMYIAPVGIANAGDPRGAYAEAIDLTGAHQSSYGREAAGVLAAMVAASVAPGAGLDDVVEAALSVAHDGTAAALRAVVDAFSNSIPPSTDEQERALARRVREVVAPFDSVGPHYRQMSMDARRPSRTKSIEELPAALGLVLGHRGEYRGSVLASVNYGRDADSIASMAGAICAGLGGTTVVPAEWVDAIDEASRTDLRATGRLMASAAADILRADRERALARVAGIGAAIGEEA
ncbi:ADP-ribosylglycohydrolase [Saccharopolyspora antimicrobica]|uniref:ADP-ribosylglycohydrolase n=1 Tax=Saccharopolyspora antimicrobica TaxID=455193 RepID=A0A1I4VNN3_9PSEU|nr:ADP-ribosylglycohydrolase family protein [Saccharopolyspora antimicrobica]RKT87295.1 ADP-ribosylglycohydrolase [Saccharopolyspora antimicrobica]SFN02705.1 ADP-ribosylglycohydrolase [Saccharopolyspora antimicrobica]